MAERSFEVGGYIYELSSGFLLWAGTTRENIIEEAGMQCVVLSHLGM
jgi:hypothetical protein